ncbi:hypothetical protein [Micromonospora sp. SH-82]|uniref:hypothetical protein n=1 Tax=Micromonospora sp. SH-82 TaxID=3132938 RepID=UPI003EBEBE70
MWSAQGTLPGALTNATLNRYGPNTKAAVVLAAANRMLQGPTEAVGVVCRHLTSTGCDAEVRLAVWAGLVLEVYRAQPALVVAAVQARQVQRSLSASWGTQVDRAGVTGADTPSEIHPPSVETGGTAEPDEATARWQPTSLHLVDATLPAVGLADDPVTGPGLVTTDALDDIASAWCHRLLGVGRPGRGVVWLTEDSGGSRRVHAMARVGAVVAPFVAATLGGTYKPDRPARSVLPTLPTAAALADAPLLHRRAHLLTAHITANYLRYRDELLLLTWPELRQQTRELVARAVRRCAHALDSDDPVTLQLRAYEAYLDVWDPMHAGSTDSGSSAGGAADLAATVNSLTESQRTVVQAWRSEQLDPGAAAYLLEIGNVALRDADGDPSVVGAAWSAILEARGLDPEIDLATQVDSLSDAQVFHLHHYAAWLARGRRRVDLRRALTVQERVASVREQVARREPAGFAAKSAAARAGYELAAEIATELALATPDREGRARTQALHTAVRYAQLVLADPSTMELLRPAGSQPATRRTARVVARALSVAATHEVAISAADAATAVDLVDAVTGDSAHSRSDDGHRDVRPLNEAQLSELRTWRRQLVDVRDADSST